MASISSNSSAYISDSLSCIPGSSAYSSNSLPYISGYSLLSRLYMGSRTAVYRGLEEASQQTVIIKILKQDYPSFRDLLQFRNQYTITQNLNIPGIVCPYSLESCGNSYALIMEDFGGVSLQQYTQNHALSLLETVTIGLQLTDILHDLYQARIIHKDIKPANILIQPESKQIKLIDFSIASLLPKELEEIKNPNGLEGTLAYLAPEQTGRMNRGIDYRADFYSLGVTLFELLTGQLPFQTNDPMELVHCHLAKQPPFLQEFDLPAAISDIVLKLMAKNAEDRYQSALGLKHDLENCLHQLKETGHIQPFEIGTRDICDRFLIPEKLYGRSTEINTLLDAFERVALGSSEIMLVAGFSGIGKTAVINEIHKPITRQYGYFIKGKFDQFNRNIPLSGFVQALRDLIGQLLSESDEQLAQWKARILAAVGDNGQVLIKVMPELECLIGQQPPAPELSGTAAQNRFNLLFQNFIKVLTTAEHPLVIFLDDLQWSDAASLQLMKVLMAEQTYLLLLGAYRDNEVRPSHPFMMTLKELKKVGKTVNTLTLAPLTFEDTNQLVADTLHCATVRSQPLTDLINRKTQGNPFFTTQFLKVLHEEGYITFNYHQGYWECDLAQVNALSLTDDVVEFVGQQLQKLPSETQQVLKLAACIGSQFDLATLAIISDQSEAVTATALWTALQERLILPTSQTYKFFHTDPIDLRHSDPVIHLTYRFLHDRVQQAAYSLIPITQKQTTHLKIGQRLLKNTTAAEQEEQIFAIVNQLNIGRSLVTQPSKQRHLLQLNLAAAQKAKLSTAYGAATQYLDICIDLLPNDCWQSQTDLTRTLYELAAEVAYVSTHYARMEQLATTFLTHTDQLVEKIRIYELKMLAARAQSQLVESIQIGLEILKLLGITFPAEPTPADIGQALQQTLLLWQGRSIPDLAAMPVMTDPIKQAAMQILTRMVPAAYQAVPLLMPLLIFKQVELSILDGNCKISPFAYADYGLVLCGVVGNLEAGYQFGQLALTLVEQFYSKASLCRTYFVVHTYTSHWKASLSSRLPYFQAAYQAGLEAGDLEDSALNAISYCAYAYFAGCELSSLAGEMETYRQSLLQLKQDVALTYQLIYYQTVLNLLGQTNDCCQLVGQVYDEIQGLPILQQCNNRSGLYYLFCNKTILCYLFEQYQQAAEYAILVESYADAMPGMFAVPVFYYYRSLIALALYPTLTEAEQLQSLKKITADQKQLKHWADHAPMNHSHKFYLVEAELHRVLGNKLEALEYYDLAIADAKAHGYIQEEALSHELAARFYLVWGKEKVAAAYLQTAYYNYSRWGAKAKVEDLEQRYPHLLQPILQQAIHPLSPLETLATIATPHLPERTALSFQQSSSTGINAVLDFAAVLKASQVLSGTIRLEELVQKLTQIVLQNSGGDHCVLILNSWGQWQVQAITSAAKTTLCSEPLDAYPDLPLKLIHYVKNTQEVVVVDELETELPIIDDYLRQQQPKSILCLPILNQGKLLGILYLKNQATSGVFTHDRILILNFLCTQAAISLENARLYQQAQHYTQELEQSQIQIIQSEKMASLGNLVAGVAHEINNPISFLNGSLNNAKDYVRDLIEHLELYQKHHAQTANPVQENAAEIDLAFLCTDLPKLLDSMQGATNRIKAISTSLRTFSRADTEHQVTTDLHEGIDSTLLILKYRLKANDNRPDIQVIKDYGNLPKFKCFPGQLNQVFMNILANAIDIFDEAAQQSSYQVLKENPQIITIQTTPVADGSGVEIRLRDNGQGMPETVKARVFDHLFTTKDVGKGTGLGLAIARQIVTEKHGGTLNVESKLGQGTEFCIRLPISGQ